MLYSLWVSFYSGFNLGYLGCEPMFPQTYQTRTRHQGSGSGLRLPFDFKERLEGEPQGDSPWCWNCRPPLLCCPSLQLSTPQVRVLLWIFKGRRRVPQMWSNISDAGWSGGWEEPVLTAAQPPPPCGLLLCTSWVLTGWATVKRNLGEAEQKRTALAHLFLCLRTPLHPQLVLVFGLPRDPSQFWRWTHSSLL